MDGNGAQSAAQSAAQSQPAYWQQCFEAERIELVRSEKVQGQLRTVLQTLQQRCDELEGQNARLRAQVQPDSHCQRLESEVEAAQQACLALQARQSALAVEAARREQEYEDASQRAAALFAALAETQASCSELEEACQDAQTRRESALTRARSMVMAEALDRAAAEASELQQQLSAQEAETARLRQALADSWANRSEEPLDDNSSKASDAGADLKDLEGMEEELKWLAKMQEHAGVEMHRIQKLERTQAALQAELREANDENAALRNSQMDLGDAGKAMREAIASQSERYIGRVDNLAEARQKTDEDRQKLLQESADLQARLASMSPDLEDVSALEERHAELEAERRALATESERLHSINAALGVQLLGEEGAPSIIEQCLNPNPVGDVLTRALQLQRRLVDRDAVHAMEKQQLADRIRDLERAAAQGISSADEPSAAEMLDARRTAARGGKEKFVPPGRFSAATSILKGVLGR